MKKQELFQVYQDGVLPTYTKTPLIFVKGKGSFLWDIDNRRFLDFFPGWGVGNLGHCHPKVVQAVREQSGKLIFVPNNYYHPGQARLVRELSRHTFAAKMFFCNSGAEANEGAIKFSRKYGKGRYEVISFLNSFHGRTLAALAATGQEKYQRGFEPLPAGFKSIPFNDLAAVRSAVSDKTAAILIELIQGEGGINIASPDFVKGLRALCDERDILLIVDEVQTGIGRTGTMFCYQHYGIEPDIMTLAKALGGGLPIGMMVVRKAIAETLQPGMHASTFGGGPVVTRAAEAVLKAVRQERLLSNASQKGEYLREKLRGLAQRYPLIKEIRGKGLMVGVELSVPGKALVEECMKRGLLINCTHDCVLRLMPALSVSKKEIDTAMGILTASLETVAKG